MQIVLDLSMKVVWLHSNLPNYTTKQRKKLQPNGHSHLQIYLSSL